MRFLTRGCKKLKAVHVVCGRLYMEIKEGVSHSTATECLRRIKAHLMSFDAHYWVYMAHPTKYRDKASFASYRESSRFQAVFVLFRSFSTIPSHSAQNVEQAISKHITYTTCPLAASCIFRANATLPSDAIGLAAQPRIGAKERVL